MHAVGEISPSFPLTHAQIINGRARQVGKCGYGGGVDMNVLWSFCMIDIMYIECVMFCSLCVQCLGLSLHPCGKINTGTHLTEQDTSIFLLCSSKELVKPSDVQMTMFDLLFISA